MAGCIGSPSGSLDSLCFLVVDKMMVEEGLRNAQSVKISQIQFRYSSEKLSIGKRYCSDTLWINPETAVRVL